MFPPCFVGIVSCWLWSMSVCLLSVDLLACPSVCLSVFLSVWQFFTKQVNDSDYDCCHGNHVNNPSLFGSQNLTVSQRVGFSFSRGDSVDGDIMSLHARWRFCTNKLQTFPLVQTCFCCFFPPKSFSILFLMPRLLNATHWRPHHNNILFCDGMLWLDSFRGSCVRCVLNSTIAKSTHKSTKGHRSMWD